MILVLFFASIQEPLAELVLLMIQFWSFWVIKILLADIFAIVNSEVGGNEAEKTGHGAMDATSPIRPRSA